jgi:hypothetical protein
MSEFSPPKQGVLAAIKHLGNRETRMKEQLRTILVERGGLESLDALMLASELTNLVSLVAEGYCNMMIETAREERAEERET